VLAPRRTIGSTALRRQDKVTFTRRNFIRSGFAAVAIGAGPAGLTKAMAASPAPLESSSTGWEQLPSILASIVPPEFPDRDFTITEFGALPGGANCNPAIGDAIEACHRSGGGRVVIPAGTWISEGPVHLLSNVNLYLEEGATLNFAYNPEAYLPLQLVRWQGIRCYNYSPLIYAFQQENIAVTGSGLLNAYGAITWDNWTDLSTPDWDLLQEMAVQGVPVEDRRFGLGHYLRPGFFEPYDCQNILVQGVTFQGSPFWTMHPTFCSNVRIENVTVLPGARNDDGCDPDSCTNVWVSGCNFTTIDDNVAIKAGQLPDAEGLPGSENIVFENCHCLGSTWSGLCVGSNIGGSIRNVFMENCTVTNCINALYLKAWINFGGIIEDIYIRSIQIGVCHHLLTMQPNAYPGAGDLGFPLFFNINVQDISCSHVEEGIFLLQGYAQRPIQTVILTDISVVESNGSQVGQIENTSGLSASNVTLAGKLITVSG
jgi:polygalacturonase